MKAKQETIFSDREAVRNRDLEILARDFNINYDDPIMQAIMTAWDYGYMEAIMREKPATHNSHQDN